VTRETRWHTAGHQFFLNVARFILAALGLQLSLGDPAEGNTDIPDLPMRKTGNKAGPKRSGVAVKAGHHLKCTSSWNLKLCELPRLVTYQLA